MIYGLKQREIPLDKINSISQKKGLLLGNITIQDGATAIKIENIDKNSISPFVDTLNSAIDAFKTPLRSTSAPSQFHHGADELRKFKELLDEGIITKEEFDTKKRQILGM